MVRIHIETARLDMDVYEALVGWRPSPQVYPVGGGGGALAPEGAAGQEPHQGDGFRELHAGRPERHRSVDTAGFRKHHMLARGAAVYELVCQKAVIHRVWRESIA